MVRSLQVVIKRDLEEEQNKRKGRVKNNQQLHKVGIVFNGICLYCCVLIIEVL